MQPPVESLNAAVAAAVILYEARSARAPWTRSFLRRGRAAGRGTPLAERMRPRTFDEFVGQEDLLVARAGRCERRSSATSCSRSSSGDRRARARPRWRASSRTRRKARFVSFSAVLAGIKEIREVMAEAERLRRATGRRTIVFIDEIHRFNKAQQDAFLPARRGRRHRPHRRDDREPVVRGQRRAAVALEGVRAARPRPRPRCTAILARALEDAERGLGGIRSDRVAARRSRPSPCSPTAMPARR